MALTLPPPPTNAAPGDLVWLEWYRQLRDFVGGTSGSLPWVQVDKTGANITDIPTRNHNNLQSIQGGTSGEYYHLNADQAGFSVSLTGQTGSIGATTITTPTGSGMWDVSVYHVCTTAGTGGTLTTNILYNDGTAARTIAPAANISLAATNYAGGVTTMRCLTANAIQYSTTVAGATGSPQYALYIKLRKVT